MCSIYASRSLQLVTDVLPKQIAVDQVCADCRRCEVTVQVFSRSTL